MSPFAHMHTVSDLGLELPTKQHRGDNTSVWLQRRLSTCTFAHRLVLCVCYLLPFPVIVQCIEIDLLRSILIEHVRNQSAIADRYSFCSSTAVRWSKQSYWRSLLLIHCASIIAGYVPHLYSVWNGVTNNLANSACLFLWLVISPVLAIVKPNHNSGCGRFVVGPIL